MSELISGYLKFRGQCKKLVDSLIKEDSTLMPIRGYYHCPFWGKQAHWWAVTPKGEIVDPSARQFPSKGKGEYEPFNGIVECSECKKELREEEAMFDGQYAFCSTKCNMKFVGL